MDIGETRKDQELPRISVNISADMEKFLEEHSASEKRSMSAQASVMLESHGAFLGWKAMNNSPAWTKLKEKSE